MGDRTNVRLRVPTELYEQTEAIFKKVDGKCNDEYPEGDEHVFCFDEVNYGYLNCLDGLQAAGIPYDNEWGTGSDYGPGTKSCRFTEDGEAIVKEIGDHELSIAVHVLMLHLEDHAKLKEVILLHNDRIGVLPWDNQVEYGKLYRLKRLICPT